MPLSWNEIKDRTLRFSREWKGEGSERAEAQSFWNGFFAFLFALYQKDTSLLPGEVPASSRRRRISQKVN
jgi:hypothetical protein